jgi:CheY-like chemotaxis protein
MEQRSVLLVDDEDDIREVAQVSLEYVAGWRVLPARSGEEAIRLAREVRPDVILLDVMMPDMDGPTTYQKLRGNDHTRDIPVILLTAKVQASDRKRFEDLGVSGIISKPFDPMNLAREISNILGWT